MSPLECLEKDLHIVGSTVGEDLTKLPPASEINPAEENTLEERVWAGFQECAETGCMTEERATIEFYVWRNQRLGHAVADHLLNALPPTC